MLPIVVCYSLYPQKATNFDNSILKAREIVIFSLVEVRCYITYIIGVCVRLNIFPSVVTIIVT